MTETEIADRLAKIANVENHYVFHCPGCDHTHQIVVKPDARGWQWNGSLTRPTFRPSYLVHETPVSPRCHSFITEGQIAFGGDCTHHLAGQTVPLPAWPHENWGGVEKKP